MSQNIRFAQKRNGVVAYLNGSTDQSTGARIYTDKAAIERSAQGVEFN